jgi:hypothetical protein
MGYTWGNRSTLNRPSRRAHQLKIGAAAGPGMFVRLGMSRYNSVHSQKDRAPRRLKIRLAVIERIRCHVIGLNLALGFSLAAQY